MKIIAITSCPTGVAHTYMAASRLEQGAKELNYKIKVEKQGAKGIEDKLSSRDIMEADLLIFAVETKVKEVERFEGKKIYYCPVVDPIKDPILTIQRAIKYKNNQDPIKNNNETIKSHILTGVSYMIPIVIAASVIMGIARIGGMALNVTDIWDSAHANKGLLGFFHTLDGLGGTALGLMLPIFAGYISYSIADRPGLASGLAGGMLAKNIDSGFFGALAAGLVAGYITKWLSKNIKLKGAASSLGPVFIIPVGSVLITMLTVNYIIGVPFATVNRALINGLNSLSGKSTIFMAFVVGGMVGFDLGGPINKAAVVTAMGLLESGVYAPNTAAQVAIIVPALGYGVASLIKGELFSNSYKNAGSASLIMGLVGVSEGAIPFTLANPKILVPLNVIGCGVAASLAVGLGSVNQIPISGIYGWFLVSKWPIYVLSIGIGTAIVAVGAILTKSSFQSDGVENVF